MIYFVQAKRTGCIKIGYSFALEQRLSALKTECGQIKILGVMKGGLEDEKILHSRFAHLKAPNPYHGREWFFASQELIEYINQFTKPYSKPPKPVDPYSGYKAVMRSHLHQLVLNKAATQGHPIKEIDIVHATGLDWNIVTKWWHGRLEAFEANTVYAFMQYLGCRVGDLITVEQIPLDPSQPPKGKRGRPPKVKADE